MTPLPMPASDDGPPPAPGAAPPWRALAELLSSMRFAVALLAAICLAAVIGTVLPQGQPHAVYVEQFGPFWAEVFARAGLYGVYGTAWFMAMLGVLIASTSLCLVRTTPRLLADWRSYREDLRLQSLQAFEHRDAAVLPGSAGERAALAARQLRAHGWRVRVQQRQVHGQPAGSMVAAQKGGARKLGYVATHAAIVLIGLGGLADSGLMLRGAMWLQGVTPFEGGGRVADVPDRHRLGTGTPGYRASLAVAEGTQASVALIGQGAGVVLQPLPFSIELQRFIVEYYPSGMPRLFASEVVLHDRQSGERRPARIEVNRPASFDGVRIYQSSFEDGGSRLALRAMPTVGGGQPFALQATVGVSQPLRLPWRPGEDWTLEPTDLRVMNVEPARPAAPTPPTAPTAPAADGPGGDRPARPPDVRAADPARLGGGASAPGFAPPTAPPSAFGLGLGAAARPDGDRRFRNLGPSLAYRLRDGAGQATEFVNYMQPVDAGDGLPVYLYGVRVQASGEPAYWRVPSDVLAPAGGQADFWRLQAALGDAGLRRQAVEQYARTALDSGQARATQAAAALQASAARVLELFAGPPDAARPTGGQRPGQQPAGGLQAISAFLERQVPAAQREQATRLLIDVLNGVLYHLLAGARAAEGLPTAAPAPAAPLDAYLRLAVLALNDARLYPAPVVLELADFEQVQASVFQVTRSPGQPWVYLGGLLLAAGIFAMLYGRERRLWLWLAGTDHACVPPDAPGPAATATRTATRTAIRTVTTRAQLAYGCNRRTPDAGQEFDALRRLLLAPPPGPPGPPGQPPAPDPTTP